MIENDEAERIKTILADHEKRIKSLEEKLPILQSQKPMHPEDRIGIEKLAEKIGVSTEKLQELFDIENGTLTLLKVIGEDESEKTKKISLVVLLGYKYLFGNERVLSKEIRRNVAENRIPVNNFATFLNEMIPSLIRRIGKSRSPKTTYKLTPLGEAEAKKTTKELCK